MARTAPCPRHLGDDFTAEVWNQALDLYENDPTVELALNHPDPTAVAAWRPGRINKLISIASLEDGGGRALIEALPRPLWCKGADSAKGFYEAMGFIALCPIQVGGRPAHVYVLL